MSRHHRTDLVLDRAYIDEEELRLHLSHLLDARITTIDVHEIDQVRDTTTVTVGHQDQRWSKGSPAAPGAIPEAATAQPPAGAPRILAQTAPLDAGRGGSHARH